MTRKKTVVRRTEIVVPSKVDIPALAAELNCKSDVIAVLLHQWAVMVAKSNAETGWVPLKAVLLRRLHRRSEVILDGLERLGIMEIERNAKGRKSYVAGELAKKLGQKPSSTRYRLNPALSDNFDFYNISSPTVSKAFWRNCDSLRCGESAETSNPTRVQNDQHETVLNTINTDNTNILTNNNIEDDGRFDTTKPECHAVTVGFQLSTQNEHTLELTRSGVAKGKALSGNTNTHSIPPAETQTPPDPSTEDKVGRSVRPQEEMASRNIEDIVYQYRDAAGLFSASQAGKISNEEFSAAFRWLCNPASHQRRRLS